MITASARSAYAATGTGCFSKAQVTRRSHLPTSRVRIGSSRQVCPMTLARNTRTQAVRLSPAGHESAVAAPLQPTVRSFDFLVLGSGIAGLSYALKVAEYGSVAVVSRAPPAATPMACCCYYSAHFCCPAWPCKPSAAADLPVCRLPRRTQTRAAPSMLRGASPRCSLIWTATRTTFATPSLLATSSTAASGPPSEPVGVACACSVSSWVTMALTLGPDVQSCGGCVLRGARRGPKAGRNGGQFHSQPQRLAAPHQGGRPQCPACRARRGRHRHGTRHDALQQLAS